jgi:hypothetical protein
MNNHIEIFQKNTQTIACFVSGLSNLALYDATLTVKKHASDPSTLISKLGIVSDPSTTYVFNLTNIDTSIAPGDYCYDITLESSANGVHTVVRDRFSILDSVKL